MNYFKIGGNAYRAEIRERPAGSLPPEVVGSIEVFDADSGRWRCVGLHGRYARPAARRALKREIERLAIGPDGKRANWTTVRRGPTIRIRADVSRALRGLYRASDAIRRFGTEAERASGAFGDLNQALAQSEGSGARRIIERAAAKMEISVPEFVRRVRGEVEP